MRMSFTTPYLPLCQFGSPASLELFAKLRIALSLIANCQEEPVAQQFCAGNCMFILLVVGTSFHSMYLCRGQHPVMPVTFLFSVFTTLCPMLGLSRRFVATPRFFTVFVVDYFALSCLILQDTDLRCGFCCEHSMAMLSLYGEHHVTINHSVWNSLLGIDGFILFDALFEAGLCLLATITSNNCCQSCWLLFLPLFGVLICLKLLDNLCLLSSPAVQWSICCGHYLWTREAFSAHA